jgi:hypothetical protein
LALRRLAGVGIADPHIMTLVGHDAMQSHDKSFQTICFFSYWIKVVRIDAALPDLSVTILAQLLFVGLPKS